MSLIYMFLRYSGLYLLYFINELTDYSFYK